MSNTEHYRKLERMYLGARCNLAHFKDLEIEIGEGTAEVRLPIAEDLKHAADSVHGSFYFKLMDDAAFFACNSLVTDVFVLTSSFHLNFTRPVGSGQLIAKGMVIKSGPKRYFAEANLYNQNGKLLATGTGNFVRSTKALTPEIGYR